MVALPLICFTIKRTSGEVSDIITCRFYHYQISDTDKVIMTGAPPVKPELLY